MWIYESRPPFLFESRGEAGPVRDLLAVRPHRPRSNELRSLSCPRPFDSDRRYLLQLQPRNTDATLPRGVQWRLSNSP